MDDADHDAALYHGFNLICVMDFRHGLPCTRGEGYAFCCFPPPPADSGQNAVIP